MKEDTIYLIFNKLYPNIKIKTIEFLPRQMMNENEEWVDDYPSIFIGVGYHEDADFDTIRENGDISEFISNLTGFEVNVFIS